MQVSVTLGSTSREGFTVNHRGLRAPPPAIRRGRGGSGKAPRAHKADRARRIVQQRCEAAHGRSCACGWLRTHHFKIRESQGQWSRAISPSARSRPSPATPRARNRLRLLVNRWRAPLPLLPIPPPSPSLPTRPSNHHASSSLSPLPSNPM